MQVLDISRKHGAHISSIHMFWSTCVNNKDYSQFPTFASQVVAQHSIESDDDCLSDDDDFEFDEKLMKHISGGSSSAAPDCVSKIGDIVGSATAASTQTKTTTTTLFTKDVCPRRFSDCASDALPELSTQPSISAQSSGSSSSQDKHSVVAVVGGNSVVVGGGDQQQQQQKRGGSLDSGMRNSMIRMEDEPEQEEEEHLLHSQL